MRIGVNYILTVLFLLLAVVPWVITSCTETMPVVLRMAPENYEATKEAMQDAEIEAQREQPSVIKVVPVGTVAPDTSTAGTAAETPTPLAENSPESTTPVGDASAGDGTLDGTTESTTESTIEPATDTPRPPPPTATAARDDTDTGASTVSVVGSMVLTQTITPTPLQIVVTSVSATSEPTSDVSITATPLDTSNSISQTVASTQTTSIAQTSTLTKAASTGQSQVIMPVATAVTDLLTEQMITDQLMQDTGDLGISDMIVRLTPDGIAGFGSVAGLFGRTQNVETSGQFIVENESLKVNIVSITLGGRDVTEQFSGQLEETVNSSLYRLLPQKYVQSFELGFGEVTVQSELR